MHTIKFATALSNAFTLALLRAKPAVFDRWLPVLEAPVTRNWQGPLKVREWDAKLSFRTAQKLKREGVLA